MIARKGIRGLIVASSTAAVLAAPGLATAAIIPPSTSTITLAGTTVTATASEISTDQPGGTVQCTLIIDGNEQSPTSERVVAPANFTLTGEVTDGDHLVINYCADYPEGSDTPASYPTVACAMVSLPAATVEERPNDRCFVPAG
ncbi:hypothetical protein [Nocardia callitridis]